MWFLWIRAFLQRHRLYACQLFKFTVKLLNLPTDIAHLLYSIRRILKMSLVATNSADLLKAPPPVLLVETITRNSFTFTKARNQLILIILPFSISDSFQTSRSTAFDFSFQLCHQQACSFWEGNSKPSPNYLLIARLFWAAYQLSISTVLKGYNVS